jgi:hypothetical protein
MKHVIKMQEVSEYKYYLLLLPCSILFLLWFSPYTTPLNPYYGYDTAVFMLIGKGWLKGYLPYVDLFDHKGPVIYMIQYIGQWLSLGKNGIFCIQSVNLFFCLVIIYKIARLFLNNKNHSFAIVLFFLLLFSGTIAEGNMVEEWSLIPILFPTYLSFRILLNNNYKNITWFYFFCGICFGILALIRLNNAAIICGLMFGVLLLLIKDRQYIVLLKSSCLFILGISIFVIPIFTYFYIHDYWRDMLYGTFLFNLKYAVSNFEERTFRLILMNTYCLLSCILLPFMALKWDKVKNNQFSYILIPVSVFSFLNLVGGFGYIHYFTIIIPIATLCSIFCIYYLWNTNKFKTVIILLCLFSPFAWQSSRTFGKEILFNIGRINDPYYMESQVLFSHIPDNEKNDVWPYDVFADIKILPYNNIIPCYKYFFLQNKLPLCDDKISNELINYLEKTPPKWIIAKRDIKGILERYKSLYEVVYITDPMSKLDVCLYKLKD